MTGSRRAVLDRIRAALAAAPPDPVQVPRDYDRAPAAGPGDADRFADAVCEYRAQVLRVDVADIAPTVAGLIRSGGRAVVPPDLPAAWVRDLDVTRDSVENPLPVAELDQADAVVTGCALGIAATGTIVLDAGAAHGRRVLTLVPDHHVCVVFPSATSDIELARVEGVHGPRRLDVLLVRR